MADSTLFKSARAKVARASESLKGLELEFRVFSNSKPYRIGNEFDSEIGEILVIYYPITEIPERWSVICGEILFNLRSALDHAIEELTVKKQGAPLKDTEFPIFDDKEKFSRTKADGITPAPRSGLDRIRGLSQKTIDCIESLQPYHATDAGKVSILSVLHEMNNRDKHRELHIVRQMIGEAELSYAGKERGITFEAYVFANLDERAILARFNSGIAFNTEMQVNANVAIEVAFDKGTCTAFKKDEGVITMLTALINGVGTILLKLENSL